MAVSTWIESPIALINFASCHTLNIVGVLFPERNLFFLNFFENDLPSEVPTEIVCIKDCKDVEGQALPLAVEIFGLDWYLFMANQDFPGPDRKYGHFSLFLLK